MYLLSDKSPQKSKSSSSSNPARPTPADSLPHIGQMIKGVLKSRHLSGAWLALQLGCDRTNIYKMFKKSTIDTQLLLKISIILEHDFFEMYSSELKLVLANRVSLV